MGKPNSTVSNVGFSPRESDVFQLSWAKAHATEDDRCVPVYPEGISAHSRWLSAAIPPDGVEIRHASRRDASARGSAYGGVGRGEGDFPGPLTPALSPTVESPPKSMSIVGERGQNSELRAGCEILFWLRLGRSLALPSLALPILSLGLLLLALASSACAQAPATPKKSTQDPDLKGSLGRSLSFARDREMETRLRGAHTAFATGHSVDGVRMLSEFLSLDKPHNIQVGTSFRDIRDEATRLLRTGSVEVREQFRRETEVRAAGELREALASGDAAILATIANRYPFTPTARECVETLASQFYDHGQFDKVIQSAQHWIEHSPDPWRAAQESPKLIELWASALREVGGSDLAEQLAAQYPVPLGPNPFRSVATGPATPRKNPDPPDAMASWDVPSEVPPPVFVLLRKVLNDLSRQGVQPSLVIRPLVLDDRIVWRSLTEIVCVQRHSGEVLWRKPIADPAMKLIAQLDAKSDPNLERRLRMELGHRVLRNSIFGQLTSDGERVYCIEQAPFSKPAPKPQPALNTPPSEGYSPVPDLTVVAYSLADGSVQWKSHEVWGERYQGTSLFGPPVLHGASLYSVVQQRDRLLMLRMDARTGSLDEVDGVRVLGDAPLLVLDPRRMIQACPIVWHKGLAICATGTGAVAAIDVYTGQLSWGFRHARDDVEVAPGMLQPPVDRFGWSWMAGWQTPQLVLLGTNLVYASPETNQIRCLDAQSGDLKWEVPTAGARTLVGGDGERIVIAGSGFARSLRLTDGHVEREYRSPVPVVTASWTGAVCQLALRDGRQVAWNPATGEASASSSGDQATGEPLLAWSGSQLRIAGAAEQFLIRNDRVGVNQPVIEASQRVVFRSAKERPFAERKATLLTTRVNGLSMRPASEPPPAGPVAQRPPVEIDWASRSTQTWPRPLAEWVDAETTYRDLHRAVIDRELPTALNHLFRLLELQPESWEVDLLASRQAGSAGASGLDSARTVRLEAVLRGIMQDLWDSASPEQRSAILTAFQQWASLPATQVGDLARPLEQLSFLPQRSLERPFAGKTLSELAIQQFDLRRQSAHEAGPAAAAALWRLAELDMARGDWGDAAGLIEQLQRRFGEIAVRGGETPREIVKSVPAYSPVLTRIDSDRRTAWPDREPIVTSKESHMAAENQVPLPIRAERGTLFDHLNVTYAPIGPSQLRFSGLGKKKPWTLSLPPSKYNHEYRQHHPDLRRGWAFGQFLVVQVGTEVFCVSSLNSRGETTSSLKNDTILWPPKSDPQDKTNEPIDTLGNEDNSLLSFEKRTVPQVVGFVRPPVEFIDAHGHRTTWVGPVSAGTLCFLQQGMLVCLDTATGRELWRRYDMPPGVRTFGDVGVIVMTHDGQPTIDVLSPMDGRTLRSYQSAFPPEGLLKHWGRLALVATGQPAPGTPFGAPDKATAPTPAKPVTVAPAELQLRMVDLSGPTTLWERMFSPGSAAFEIDEDWLGVLTAEGKVVFLDIRTGQTVRESKVEVPRGLQQIVTAVTERTIYVSLSSPVTEKKLVNAAQVFQSQPGWRRAFVNGPLHAFDRLSGEYQWTRRIENRTLSLDQVRDVPLLVCADLWKEPKDPQPHARYWCLDARTGKVVLDTSIPKTSLEYTVERDLEQGWVELRLGDPHSNHRFSYVPAPTEEK